MWTRRALPSPSGPSSSSTLRKPSELSYRTRLPPAATRPRFCASSTLFRLVTSTRSPPRLIGCLVTMSSFTPASRTSRPRSCSPNSAKSSHTLDSPLYPRRRLPSRRELRSLGGGKVPYWLRRVECAYVMRSDVIRSLLLRTLH